VAARYPDDSAWKSESAWAPGSLKREASLKVVELRLLGLDSPLLDDIEEEILPLAR
jgi:hypothetical protein